MYQEGKKWMKKLMDVTDEKKRETSKKENIQCRAKE